MNQAGRETVDFICICREEPLLKNTAKFNMLKYKHILSLSKEIHLSISEPENKNTHMKQNTYMT